MTEKRERVFVCIPKGVAVYPWLTKADTKYNAAGEYHTKVRVSKDDEGVAGLIEQLEAMADEKYTEVYAELISKKKAGDAKKLKKYYPFAPVYDDEGNETNDVEFTAKMKAVVTPKGKEPFTQKPKLFDAAGKEIVKPPAVYGGSIIKINCEAVPFYNAAAKSTGATLRLRAVQIIELVTGDGGDASSYGFEAEDGYTAEEEQNGEGFKDETGGDDGDGTDASDF